MSTSPGVWKVFLTFVIQVKPAELHEFQLSCLPVGIPFRHCWIQVLRQWRKALLHLSTLLLPCCPVWYQDGRQQLPLTLSPCYSPEPITMGQWDLMLRWARPGSHALPTPGRCSMGTLELGSGRGGFTKRKPGCFYQKTEECMLDRQKQ